MQKRKNAALNPHPWSLEQHQAWEEMPKGINGWIAPATLPYRARWKEWWKKWGEQFWFTPIWDGYERLKIERAKNLSKESTVGNEQQP